MEGFAQIRVPFAHFLPIIGRIGGIRQDGDDVRDDKPPFVVMQRAADFAPLKQGNAGLGIAVGFIHGKSSVFMVGACCPHWEDRQDIAGRPYRPLFSDGSVQQRLELVHVALRHGGVQQLGHRTHLLFQEPRVWGVPPTGPPHPDGAARVGDVDAFLHATSKARPARPRAAARTVPPWGCSPARPASAGIRSADR